jgi:plastocyanin
MLTSVMILSACGSSSPAAAVRTGRAADTIVIKNFGYTVPASVRPRATLTIRNEDNVAHTATSTSGRGFDAKVGPSTTTTMTAPSEPGRYRLICTYHPYMHAVLVVKA